MSAQGRSEDDDFVAHIVALVVERRAGHTQALASKARISRARHKSWVKHFDFSLAKALNCGWLGLQMEVATVLV